MGDVLDFEKPGFITYKDVIDNLILPDKTGFCSAFSDSPLGKSGEVQSRLRNYNLRGQQMPSPRPWKIIRYFHSTVRNPS